MGTVYGFGGKVFDRPTALFSPNLLVLGHGWDGEQVTTAYEECQGDRVGRAAASGFKLKLPPKSS